MFFSYDNLKLKLGLALTGCIIAMVTYQVEKMTITCLQMFRHLLDTIIVASKREVGLFQKKSTPHPPPPPTDGVVF